MKPALLNGLRWLIVIGSVVAASYLLILVRAVQLFQQDSAVSVAAAARLQPRNAEYLDRLASWQPDDRENLLHRALAENPFDDNDWIRLGLLAEMQDGDNTAAEKFYRKAAEVNHMFLPRWTLTNFYFRQQKVAEFFHWSRETLAITPYASDPVFAQMRLMTTDEDTLHAAIPERPRILLQYAWYLSNNKQFDGIPRVVSRLVHAVGKDDPNNWGRNDMLASSEDRMLASGYLEPALKTWSILNQAGWLSQPTPDTRHPLTNGDFRTRFYLHGFDWVSVEPTGTRVQQFSDTPMVRLSLYGDQAEKLTLLQQYLPLASNGNYSATWRAEGENRAEPSGLAWHLHPIRGTESAEQVSSDLLSAQQKWDFTAPPDAKLFLLTLEYNRPPGVTRARNSVVLKSVTMNQR